MLRRKERIFGFGIWIVSVRVVDVGGMLKVCKMGLRVRNCAVGMLEQLVRVPDYMYMSTLRRDKSRHGLQYIGMK